MPALSDSTVVNLTRSLSSAPNYDKEARTVTFSFTSTAPVTRWMWNREMGVNGEFDEVLSHDPKHINLTRLKEGVLMFLDNHNPVRDLGKVIDVQLSDRTKGDCTVKLHPTPDADLYLAKLENGTAPGNSFGYRVYAYEKLSDAVYEDNGKGDRIKTKNAVLMATDWELLEISTANIPADPTVGLGKSLEVFDSPPATEERADASELAVGDYVEWDSSGGTARGRITEKRVSGSVTPKPKGKPMEGTRDNPAFLCNVYREMDGEMKATDVYVAHRAGELRRMSKPKKSVDTSEEITPMTTVTETEQKTTVPEIDYKAAVAELRSQVDAYKGEVTQLRSLITEKDEQIATLTAEKAAIEKRNTVTSQYTQLRQQAEQLVREFKLTPPQFSVMFGEKSDEDVERLCKSAIAEQELDRIAFFLKTTAAGTPHLPTETKTGNEPLPQKEVSAEELEAKAAALVAGIKNATPIY